MHLANMLYRWQVKMRKFGSQKTLSRKRIARACLLALILLSFGDIMKFLSDCVRTHSTRAESSPKDLTLVVSMYDSRRHSRARLAMHANETMAAIAVNSINCQFTFIHIIYQSTHKNCQDVLNEIEVYRSLLHHACFLALSCELHARQPTYLEFFQVAKQPRFSNTITIVANADQVFDETVGKLKRLSSTTLTVISTHGLHHEPQEPAQRQLLQYYAILTRSEFASVVQRQLEPAQFLLKETGLQINVAVTNRCHSKDPRYSWDAYAFHPENIDLHEKFFRQKDGQLYMNQLGAENVALRALTQQSSRIKKITQTCAEVNLWHFHAYKKTHTGSWADHLPMYRGIFMKDRLRKLCYGGFAPCPCHNLCIEDKQSAGQVVRTRPPVDHPSPSRSMPMEEEVEEEQITRVSTARCA